MNTKLFTLLPLVAALAACGGGGGDDANSGATSTPVVVIPGAAANLVTSIPTPTYSTGSEELAAFATLNAARQRCGFGLLKQNAALDNAARGHADWNLINNFAEHEQVAGTPGFTGVTFQDRFVSAGYSDRVFGFQGADKLTLALGLSTDAGYGTDSIRKLLNAPYHAVGLIAGFRDVGISVRTSAEAGSSFANRVTTQVNPGFLASEGPQQAEADAVLTYPCQGTVDVMPELRNETPNPVPGRNLATNPLGSSIIVSIRPGRLLDITSASMINVATGQSVLLRAPVTSANDLNAGAL